MSRNKRRNKKANSNKHIHYSILNALRKKRYKDDRIYMQLRFSTPYSVLKKVADGIPKQYRDSYLFENPMPTCWNELRNGARLSYVGDLKDELGWNSLVVEMYANTINKFVTYQKVYENLILLGKYEEASEILNRVNKNCGYSLWSLENTILVKEFGGSFEDNIQYMNEVNNEGVNVDLSLLLDFYSKKAEKSLSYSRYASYVEDAEKSISALGSGGYEKYFGFKTNLVKYVVAEEPDKVLFWESFSSVIDRYITLKRVLMEIFIDEDYQENIKQAQKIIKRLNDVISDPELKSMMLVNGIVNFKEQYDGYAEIYDLLDKYTSGKYNEIINSYKSYMEKFPDVFEVYEIIVKSFVISEKNFNIEENCLQDVIINNLYSVVAKSDSYYESIVTLLKICCQFSSLDTVRQLFLYIAKEIEFETTEEKDKRRVLYSFCSNPRKCLLAPSMRDAIKYLTKCQESYKNSVTVKFWMQYISGEIVSSDVSLNRARIYNAYLTSKNDEKLALSAFESMSIELDYNNMYYKSLIVNRLYKIYYNQKDYYKLISLICTAHFECEFLLYKVKYDIPIKELHRCKEIHNSIDYPISVFLSGNTSVRDLYVSADNYLHSIGLFVPSQLINNENISKDCLVIFFNKVCAKDVLYKFRPLKSTTDVQHERISILRHLTVIDDENKNNYLHEINEITKEMMIKRGLMQIDESKIYFNIESLKDDANTNCKEIFERYKKLSLLPYRQLLWADTDNVNQSSSLNLNKVIYFDTEQQSKYRMFSDLFLELRDKFLFSNKFGLDSYLSIRIRHGTLINELRRPFEESYLVTRKSTGSDEYAISDHWQLKLENGYEDQAYLLQEVIKRYSRTIDETIFRVKNELIQIKTESRENNGLFDYTYTQQDRAHLFLDGFDNIEEFDKFLDLVYESLRKRTSTVLDSVRLYLKSELAKHIIFLLDRYSSEVKEIGDNRYIGEFLQQIMHCKTHVQTAIDRVSNWFKISSSSYVDVFSLDFAIETAIEIVKNAYGLKLNVKFNIPDALDEFYGTCYTLFVDIFQILFTNVVKHASAKDNLERTEIECSLVGNRLKLSISNDLPQDYNYEEHEQNVLTIQNRIAEGTGEERFRKEDKSGILKIFRILKYDLRQKNPVVYPSIVKNKFSILIEFDVKEVLNENSIN